MALSVTDVPVGEGLTRGEWATSNTTATLADRAILTRTPPGGRAIRFPFRGGELAIEIVGDSPAWAAPTIQALGELLHLEPNWDTYGASPIDPRCVAMALQVAFETFRNDTPPPSVVPACHGGLQFEWHLAGVDLEVEFLSATRVSGLFEDQALENGWEEDLTFNRRPLVEALSALTR